MSVSNSLRPDSMSLPLASALTFAPTISRPPHCVPTSLTQLCSAVPSVTSTPAPSALLAPLSMSAAAVFSAAAASRAQIATSAPSAASVRAMARPIPFVPPVTIAFMPLSCKSMFLFSSSGGRQVFLADGGAHRILRVHEIAEAHLSTLAQHHVGIPTIVTIFLFEPQHELVVGDARRILERTRAADAHQ